MSIDAAWIGVVGAAVGGAVTAAVAIVNGRFARQTAEMTIEGEHRHRLWEKQSAAYEVTLKAVMARRVRREALTSRGDVGNIGSHPVEELRKAEEPEEIEIRATMRAYASEAVWAAFQEADNANIGFWANLRRLQSAHFLEARRTQLLQAGVSGHQMPPDPDYQGALDAMNRCKADARGADDVLFDAINHELAWTPSSAGTVAVRSRLGRLMRRRVPH